MLWFRCVSSNNLHPYRLCAAMSDRCSMQMTAFYPAMFVTVSSEMVPPHVPHDANLVRPSVSNSSLKLSSIAQNTSGCDFWILLEDAGRVRCIGACGKASAPNSCRWLKYETLTVF